MPTSRETILQALLAALQTVPNATVLREGVLPERLPTGGLVILHDGDPGSYDDILDKCSDAWNFFANDPGRIMSITQRDWIKVK